MSPEMVTGRDSLHSAFRVFFFNSLCLPSSPASTSSIPTSGPRASEPRRVNVLSTSRQPMWGPPPFFLGRQSLGMVFPEADAVSDDDLRQRAFGPSSTSACPNSRARRPHRGLAAARRAVGEVKDKLRNSGRALRGQHHPCASPRPWRRVPRWILLDEPCSALDPISNRQYRRIDRLSCRPDYTIVIVTAHMQQSSRASTTRVHVSGRAGGIRPDGKIFNRARQEPTEQYITDASSRARSGKVDAGFPVKSREILSGIRSTIRPVGVGISPPMTGGDEPMAAPVRGASGALLRCSRSCAQMMSFERLHLGIRGRRQRGSGPSQCVVL